MLVAAIDGGGTTTRLYVFQRKSGRGYTRVVNTPSNFYEDYDRSLDTVISLFESLRESKAPDICIVSAAGLGETDLRAKAQSDLARHLGVEVVCTGDAIPTVLGCSGGKSGIALIVGTGSVCYGFDGKRFYRAGGWGAQFDDEGSGYSLGNAVIRRILKEVDGRSNASFALSILPRAARLSPKQKLVSNLLASFHAKQEVARLAPKLLALARSGSKEANYLVNSSAEELSELVSAVYHKMADKPAVVGLTGGLVKNYYYRSIIERAIRRKVGRSVGVRVVSDPNRRGFRVLCDLYLSGPPQVDFGDWL